MKRSDLARANTLVSERNDVLTALANVGEGKVAIHVGFKIITDPGLRETITDDVRACLRRQLEHLDAELTSLGIDNG